MLSRQFCKFTENILVLFCLCINTSQAQKSKIVFTDPNVVAQRWIGKKISFFNFSDKEGNIYNDKSIHKKVFVLNLWSVFCHPCIDEFPELNELVDRYNKKEIIFLVPSPESIEQINTVISTHALNYIILPNAQSFFKNSGLIGYPYYIVVDQKGIVKYIHVGTVDRKTGNRIAKVDLPAVIDRLLTAK